MKFIILKTQNKMEIRTLNDEIEYLKKMLTSDVFYMFFSSDSGYKEVRENTSFLEVKEKIIETI